MIGKKKVINVQYADLIEYKKKKLLKFKFYQVLVIILINNVKDFF